MGPQSGFHGGLRDRGFEGPLSANNSVLSHIARPYASALFDLAGEAGELADVEAGLDQVAQLAGTSDDFASFLRSPVISADDKSATIAAIIKKAGAIGLVANFLSLVARNRRLFALVTMIGEFKRLAAGARGEMRAEITSATPLSAAHKKGLAVALKKKLGNSIALDTRVDPTLIGGLQVKVGSQMIDTSLRTKLTAMKMAMKEVG
ncbi:MAG: F0F1 ATP synthase subunit delta [Alphaproteobacteria bacterium]|nr:F0F1 ATP synthase subunit delta [Alphaproteobacteria bacterium]